MDIIAEELVNLISDHSQTLKELYLNEVYLKITDADEGSKSQWIATPDPRLPNAGVSVARCLRDMDSLHLDVLRATGLGYDILCATDDINFAEYDLHDRPTFSRSFDARFVAAASGTDSAAMELMVPMAPMEQASPMEEAGFSLSQDSISEDSSLLESEGSGPSLPEQLTQSRSWDAETYQQYRNTTSHFKRCIDGYFANHNEQALLELQRIMTLADRGMNIISEEIARSQDAQIDPATGQLENPFL